MIVNIFKIVEIFAVFLRFTRFTHTHTPRTQMSFYLLLAPPSLQLWLSWKLAYDRETRAWLAALFFQRIVRNETVTDLSSSHAALKMLVRQTTGVFTLLTYEISSLFSDTNIWIRREHDFSINAKHTIHSPLFIIYTNLIQESVHLHCFLKTKRWRISMQGKN